jgi:hypothetical protein
MVDIAKGSANTWTYVDNDTERMAIFGGWLVKYLNMNNSTIYSGRDRDTANPVATYDAVLVFVPDPEHKWDQWTQEMVLSKLIDP